MTTAFQADAFQFDLLAFQIDVGLVVQSTPGRILYPTLLDKRSRYETEAEKLARRISEGTIPRAPEPVRAIPGPSAEYLERSARLAAGIESARLEAERSRAEIASLEERLDLMGQSEIVEKRLVYAQQALAHARILEAVLMEEMEVVDVAYIAFVGLGVTLQ